MGKKTAKLPLATIPVQVRDQMGGRKGGRIRMWRLSLGETQEQLTARLEASRAPWRTPERDHAALVQAIKSARIESAA